MIDTQFPAAFYGYYPNAHGQSGYDFRFHDLPRDAQASFRTLKDQFDWPSGGGNEKYGDCYAIWPVNGEAALAARFRDMGADANYGRPHTLRIEVVLVSRKDLNDWPTGLVRFLSDLAWSNADTKNDPRRISIGLSHEPGEISPEIRSALTVPGLAAVLVAPHANVRTKELFRVVQSPGTVTTSTPQSPREPVLSREEPMTRQVRSNAGKNAGGAWGIMAVSLLIGLVAGWGATKWTLEDKISGLENKVKDRDKCAKVQKQNLDDTTKEKKEIEVFLVEFLGENGMKVEDFSNESLRKAFSDIDRNLKESIPKARNWDTLFDLTRRIVLIDGTFDASKPENFKNALNQLSGLQKKDPKKAIDMKKNTFLNDLQKNLGDYFDDNLKAKDEPIVKNKLRDNWRTWQKLNENEIPEKKVRLPSIISP